MIKVGVLDIKLQILKNFLEHNIKDIGNELDEIDNRNKSGEFQNFYQYEAEISMPFCRQEIAIRAVYFEIASIVENELQQIAHSIWINSKKHKGPKNLFELSGNNIKSLKLISDLNISNIIKLIEEYYEIKLRDIDGGEVVYNVKESVNAFKHRNGRRDFRKQDITETFPKFYKPKIEEAYGVIEQAKKFIINIREIINKNKK